MEVRSGYKKTEVGVIPEAWRVDKLDNLARVIDSLHQTPSFIDDGYPMVRVTDIKTGNLSLDGTMKVPEAIFAEFTKNYKPKRSDIVLSRVGSYGVSSFVETDAPFCMGQNTVVIQPKLPPRYLYYVLNSPSIRQQIDDGSYGSGYKSLSLRNIKDLFIPVPSTDAEQRAIATALSDVDTLIASLDRLIIKKRDMKQAAMQELLTGKRRLPGFSGEWEEDYIESFAEITTGSKNTQDRIEDGQFPFFVRSQTVERINSYSFDGEAVLTAGDGVGTGKVFHYINGKFDAHQRVYRISNFSEQVDGYFFYLCFSNNFHNRIMQMTAKSSVDSVRREMIARMPISLPPTRAEQTAIATILSDMDTELTALEQKRDKTRLLKQGMMQELLTGRIRLLSEP